jgi:hypothetical protein
LQTFSYINQEKQKIQLNKIREEKRRYWNYTLEIQRSLGVIITHYMSTNWKT